jgi:hypothetical protein
MKQALIYIACGFVLVLALFYGLALASARLVCPGLKEV